ncbi:MAG: spore cortex biosynthesis protein YabQ [Lachnospiraceae bacterium]|nr:spore cortex biosynthesis protein YabQ [Lachnospiraceae bacterium]
MMEISENIRQELGLLLASLAAGNLMVVCYDVLRILRRIVPHRMWVVALEDMLYWLLCGCAVFVLLHLRSDGVVRGFVMGGILIGMLAWNRFISTYMVENISRILQWILKKFARPIKFFLKKILSPLRFVSKYMKSCFRHTGGKLKRKLRAWKIALRKL